jgi:hypothetical protein
MNQVEKQDSVPAIPIAVVGGARRSRVLPLPVHAGAEWTLDESVLLDHFKRIVKICRLCRNSD